MARTLLTYGNLCSAIMIAVAAMILGAVCASSSAVALAAMPTSSVSTPSTRSTVVLHRANPTHAPRLRGGADDADATELRFKLGDRISAKTPEGYTQFHNFCYR